jgi:hypothetical protein
LRIKCYSLADFLTNISLPEVEISGKRVFVSKHIMPLTSNRSSVEVYCQASTVIIYGEDEEETEALVEMGELCGIDRTSDGGCTEGSDVFQAKMDELKDWCSKLGCLLLPGVLDI